jgi:hypothetical protein
MADQGFLQRKIALPSSRDFSRLRALGLEHVERLGSALWTDYNVHDPGITLLELMAYAITELGTRAEYPIRDLLTRQTRRGDAATLENAGEFQLAHEILPSSAVSFRDLRKLLLDIPGVGNAWIEKHRGLRYQLDQAASELTEAASNDAIELNGLFDVFVKYEEWVSDDEPRYPQLSKELAPSAPPPSAFVQPEWKGVVFRAQTNAKLVSVVVRARTVGELVVRLVDLNGDELARVVEQLAAADVEQTIELGFTLMAGKTYRLDAHGSGVELARRRQAFPVEIPAARPAVVLLRGHADGDDSQEIAGLRYFFFDWTIAHDATGLTKREVRSQVVERIHRHRNLCEDVVNVAELRKEEIGVCSEIELAADANAELVEAEIYYRLSQLIAPDVKFYSLAELRERYWQRGRPREELFTEEIFEGPLLDHGFIDDEELDALERRCELRASDVITEIMNVPGVLAVRSTKLLSFIDDLPPTRADWQLELSADRTRVAVFEPRRARFIFYKRDLPYYANKAASAALFAARRAADRAARLGLPAQRLLAPIGEARGLSKYYPVQNELPKTYCVGEVRVARSESPLRKAQAKQLKAYLMLFEQLFANFLAQLEGAKDLFSFRALASPDKTYFTQPVAVTDPHLVWSLGEELYGPDAEARFGADLAARVDAELGKQLERIIELRPDDALARRLRFLSHLAARYDEDSSEYAALMQAFARSTLAAEGTVDARLRSGASELSFADLTLTERSSRQTNALAATKRVASDTAQLLGDYPSTSSRRGTGFDWRFPEDAQNVAGFQARVYRLLGVHDLRRRELAGHRFVIRQNGAGKWIFALLNEEGGSAIFESIGCGERATAEALLDVALQLGGDAENYARDAGVELLMRRCKNMPDREIGRAKPGVSRSALIAYFEQYGHAEGFHLVEAILLRRRTTLDAFLPVRLDNGPDCDCPTVRDPYSFRAAVVLPSWSPRFRDARFRRFVEDTLRREAPAHVYLRICWVNHEQMRDFEDALDDFQYRLASLASEPANLGQADASTRSGRLPLPGREQELPGDLPFSAAARRLSARLQGLVNVYPLAELHACDENTGEIPQVTLNNTSLGTL